MKTILLIFPFLFGIALAQPPKEYDLTTFKSRQQEMEKLISEQKPRLEMLVAASDANVKKLNEWSETLKYPEKIQRYKEQATDELVKLKKQAEQHSVQLREFYFGWFPYTRQMMAVYTRYGEQKHAGKIEPEMTAFMTVHREHIGLMDRAAKNLKDTLNECEFLLTTRLN